MKVLSVRSGQKGDGTAWKSQEFVFEFFENPDNWWSEKVVLSLMNERIDEYQLKEGDEVRVNFGHSVKEYQGKVLQRDAFAQADEAAGGRRRGPEEGGASCGAARKDDPGATASARSCGGEER